MFRSSNEKDSSNEEKKEDIVDKSDNSLDIMDNLKLLQEDVVELKASTERINGDIKNIFNENKEKGNNQTRTK